MNQRKKIEKILYSWPAVIISLWVVASIDLPICILLYPIFFFLLYKRASLIKKKQTLAWVIMLGLALWFIVLFGIIVCMISEDLIDLNITIWSTFFNSAINGIAFFCVSMLIRNNSKKFKKYLSIVVDNGERKIDKIAESIGKPYNTVKKDLLHMISLNYFGEASIDEDSKMLVISQPKHETN